MGIRRSSPHVADHPYLRRLHARSPEGSISLSEMTSSATVVTCFIKTRLSLYGAGDWLGAGCALDILETMAASGSAKIFCVPWGLMPCMCQSRSSTVSKLGHENSQFTQRSLSRSCTLSNSFTVRKVIAYFRPQ